MRQSFDAWREVAFVRHADEGVSETQFVDDFGRGRQERYDAHGSSIPSDPRRAVQRGSVDRQRLILRRADEERREVRAARLERLGSHAEAEAGGTTDLRSVASRSLSALQNRRFWMPRQMVAEPV